MTTTPAAQALLRFDAKMESIRLIAHALEARDQNRACDLLMKVNGRLSLTAEVGTEVQYLEDAERILDSEIVRMAEERIMARIRGEET